MENYSLTYGELELEIEGYNDKADPTTGYKGGLEIYKIYLTTDHAQKDISQYLSDKVLEDIITRVTEKYEL